MASRSNESAYAAPLILPAQTRQADRDKATEIASAKHMEKLSARQLQLLQENSDLTERVAELTEKIEQLTETVHWRLAE